MAFLIGGRAPGVHSQTGWGLREVASGSLTQPWKACGITLTTCQEAIQATQVQGRGCVLLLAEELGVLRVNVCILYIRSESLQTFRVVLPEIINIRTNVQFTHCRW